MGQRKTSSWMWKRNLEQISGAFSISYRRLYTDRGRPENTWLHAGGTSMHVVVVVYAWVNVVAARQSFDPPATNEQCHLDGELLDTAPHDGEKVLKREFYILSRDLSNIPSVFLSGIRMLLSRPGLAAFLINTGWKIRNSTQLLLVS